MKHLLLTINQYKAVMKSYLLHGNIDYSRYNDPDFSYGKSADFWVIYLKEPITPTWAFDLAWYTKN